MEALHDAAAARDARSARQGFFAQLLGVIHARSSSGLVGFYIRKKMDKHTWKLDRGKFPLKVFHPAPWSAVHPEDGGRLLPKEQWVKDEVRLLRLSIQ